VAKRPKKTKTPRVKGGGKSGQSANKDAITGLDLGNGLILKSDTVYTDQSPEYKALFGNRDSSYASGGGTQIEFEINKDAVIFTSVTKGELTQNGGPAFAPDYQSQSVLIGTFVAGKGGLLKSGAINEATEWSYNPARAGTETRMASAESENIITYKTPTRFSDAQIRSNPSSIFYAFTGGQPVFWHDSQISPEQNPSFDNKNEFLGHASSAYLREGWWNNPFVPNLL
jgi:hypothetical protein